MLVYDSMLGNILDLLQLPSIEYRFWSLRYVAPLPVSLAPSIRGFTHPLPEGLDPKSSFRTRRTYESHKCPANN